MPHARSSDGPPHVSRIRHGGWSCSRRDAGGSDDPRAGARGQFRPDVGARGSHHRGAAGGDGVGEVHVPLDHSGVPAAHRGIRQEGTGSALGAREQPRRARAGGGARRGAQGQGTARAVARHPHPGEGQRGDAGPHAEHGGLALVGVSPPRDAFLVERLRAAGAVLLGKANLSEWANFRSSHSSSGWSGRGGQCRNPYALDRTPSGSSSGSGVAVAASLCAAAIGTETDGSIVSPSTCCSIVGIKPTLGLVSRAGVIPIAHNQDTAGPMARTVADAATLLGALSGVDPHDDATAASAGHSASDYSASLDSAGLKGARLGVCRSHFMGYSPGTDALMESTIDALKRLGAVIVDPADIATAGQFDDSEFLVLLYEFKADLNRYLAEWAPGATAKTLADLIGFNDRNRGQEMPYFGQEIFTQAQAKGPLTDQDYLRALDKNHLLARTQGIDVALAEHQLDALIAPTGGPPSLIDLVNGDPGGGGSFSSPAAVAGYPHVTVPMGYVAGLPVGLSFVGRPWSEAALIKFAFAFEQATKARRSPRFLPTAPIG